MKPDFAASAFGVHERLVYCACNNTKGNFEVSSMSVWGVDLNEEVSSGGVLHVTCPTCTVERLSAVTPDSKTKNPVSLISFFRTIAEREVFSERAELKRLYSVLLAGSAAGGGGVYKDSCQQSSFNGSWTCLLLHSGNKLNRMRNTRLEAEVLVSNKIKHSARLQPKCVCSDLLYAVFSSSGAPEFAYQAANISVIEGGEFLYFTYVLFEEGGPFDNKSDLKVLLNNEPTLETTDLQAAAASSSTAAANASSSEEEEDGNKKQHSRFKRLDAPSPQHVSNKVKKNNNNEADIQMLLFTVLNNKCSSGNNKKGGVGGPPPAKRRKKGATDDYDGSVNSSSNTTTNTSDITTKKDFIIPCPQIEEYTIFSQQRINALNNADSSVIKHRVTMNDTVFSITVRQHRKKYIVPVDNVLFSPPVISRTSFNKFRVLSGLSSFFDRIEFVVAGTADSVALRNNTAHYAILRLLSHIRENSLKRSVELASTKGVNFVVKTPTTNIGVPVSVREIQERQLCTASTLGMLAGLAK